MYCRTECQYCEKNGVKVLIFSLTFHLGIICHLRVKNCINIIFTYAKKVWKDLQNCNDWKWYQQPHFHSKLTQQQQCIGNTNITMLFWKQMFCLLVCAFNAWHSSSKIRVVHKLQTVVSRYRIFSNRSGRYFKYFEVIVEGTT